MDVSPWPYVFNFAKTVCIGIAIWVVVVFLISRTGWAGFARRYATTVKPASRGFFARHASFGFPLGGYNNVVYVTFMPEGMHARATIPFNIGHRPLLLPWQSVASVSRKRMFFIDGLLVRLETDAGRLTLTLPVAAQAALEAARPRERLAQP
jgi:hypothetical protein